MSSRMTSRAGSSPLARGLHGLVEGQGLVDGIIPARAGFTSSWRPARTPPRDHPRSRGVYIADAFSLLKEQGSSPLARGLRPRLHGDPLDDRIIPARAGFTPSPAATPASASDHPRSRGVYPFAAAAATWDAGSSPLARGLHSVGDVVLTLTRIIPARAGFTAATMGDGGGQRDHPRSRGVYPVLATASSSAPGIIPARAGFTGRRRRSFGRIRDHPRSRGVY